VDALLAIQGAVASVSDGGGYARPTVDLPPVAWVDAHIVARDSLGFDFFDWLTAVDELEEGFAVVTHLWSTAGKHGVLLRTRVARDAAALASIVSVYAGAAWHERETYEMFGVRFTDHPGELKPLLLAPEFEGNPLRKEFVLASRVAKDWPGAREPGESAAEGAAKRQKMRPPGVPDPNEWGPKAGQLAAADEADPRAVRRAAAAERATRTPGAADRSRRVPTRPTDGANAQAPAAAPAPDPSDPPAAGPSDPPGVGPSADGDATDRAGGD
jgi:NADH-quinone oxidoreductase subunit C